MKSTTLIALGVLLAAIPLALNYVPACGTASYCTYVDAPRAWLTTPLMGGAFTLSAWWWALAMPTVAAGVILVAFGVAKYLRRPKMNGAYPGF